MWQKAAMILFSLMTMATMADPARCKGQGEI